MNGYQIIDLKGVDHPAGNGVGVVHEGIYELVSGTRKAILMTNVVVNGERFHDRFVDVSSFRSTYYLWFMIGGTGYKVIVSDDDNVIFDIG